MSYRLVANTWGQEELNAIQSVIQSDIFTMGDYVAEFEAQFSSYFGSKYAVMVNSGSSANLLAIAALCYKKDKPLQPGDEVIVPSVSWSTTYFPITQYGMKLVFVDIHSSTLNLNDELLDAALSDRTVAIMVPNLLGNPANLEVIQQFARKHDLTLIEDNCESMGATLGEKYTGTFGVLGTFSCFYSHHIATMEGGMVVTDNEELYHLLLSLRSHGWTRHLPKHNTLCKKSDDPFYDAYRFILPGYNVRPIEMSGAIGIEQLKKLNDFIHGRRKNALLFQYLFEGDERFIVQTETGTSSWFGFSIILNPELKTPRTHVLQSLKKHQIETRPIVSGNFLKNDVIQYLNHRVVGEHDSAQLVHDYGFYVGNHHTDLSQELHLLYDVLNSIS